MAHFFGGKITFGVEKKSEIECNFLNLWVGLNWIHVMKKSFLIDWSCELIRIKCFQLNDLSIHQSSECLFKHGPSGGGEGVVSIW